MHHYDVALKHIATRPGSALLSALVGKPIVRWLNVEAPKVTNVRQDLLGESDDGELIAIEFQSRNDKTLPIRVGHYLYGTALRLGGRVPRQIVLYVGSARLRMVDRTEGPEHWLRYRLVDIRELDGEVLLASGNLGDNVMAVLTRLGEAPDTVRRILGKIKEGPAGDAPEAFAELLILAGLRKLTGNVEKEAQEMTLGPVVRDLMKNEVFGPMIRENLAKSWADGQANGQLQLLLGLARKRFGRVPAKVRLRLEAMGPDELTSTGLRILDAKKIEDLFA